MLGHRVQRGERCPLRPNLCLGRVGFDLEQAPVGRLPLDVGLHAVLGRRGAAFRILARGQLDNKTFQQGQWKAEKVDANGDDFDEVLFSGIKRNGRASHHRFVLYSPRERQAYVLEVQSSGRIGTPFKTVWSNNLLSAKTADYRRVLRARANIAVAKLRTR